MTYEDLITEILKSATKPLTVKEIWNEAVKIGLDNKLNSNSSKKPWDTISTCIYENINKKGSASIFAKVGKGLFELNKKGSATVSSSATSNSSNNKPFDEKDMYKPFIEYIKKKFSCQAKRIEETSTSIKGELEWTQPDIVGVNIPNFDNETENLIKNLQVYQCNIYSFELKKELTNSNLKKSYFQAVSNSSWASEGYLVVAKIDLNHLEEELIRLNNSFGIGIIEFNMQNPNESKIILSAKSKEELDWKTIDKLVKSNTDFEEFIKGINYIISGYPNYSLFD